MQGKIERTELTDRQKDVLGLLSRGKTQREAAQLLNIGYHTVKRHTLELRYRLGARNTAHAVDIAFRQGIL